MNKIPYNHILSFLAENNDQDEKSFLSNDKINQFKTRINKLMSEQKPFLKHRFTIRDLALELEIPSYQLSAFINTVMVQRFNHMINEFRISYCLEQLQFYFDGEIKIHKLSAACGFKNRNTFISAFKQFTKLTPSAYIHQLNRKKSAKPVSKAIG
jgi:AraC-like DNA-binding protein